jgi:hypothetical protein
LIASSYELIAASQKTMRRQMARFKLPGCARRCRIFVLDTAVAVEDVELIHEACAREQSRAGVARPFDRASLSR